LGTVFKLSQSGALTTLHTFCLQEDSCPDGESPEGLIQATDGNFYGITGYGGANSEGTIFKIDPAGNLTTLYSFCMQSGCPDGDTPFAALVQKTDGSFYGTTHFGGDHACEFAGRNYGCGTIFNLSVGLGPFVASQPTSGQVGATVTILGTNIGQATKVTFHGTSATFTVVSSSEITTTVPTGATTGTVQVVTPNGALSSNVPFQVNQ
jgi:uncharacterized repeat protein (TIGR03803 family)